MPTGQNYYRSVYSGSQIDSAIGRIINGDIDEAVEDAEAARDGAVEAKQAIEDMTVSATTLDPGSQATVTKTTVNGVVNLTYGIPRGERGPQGPSGPGTGDMLASVYDPHGKAQDIFAYALPASQKGAANGVASLDGQGRVPSYQLPSISNLGSVRSARFVIGTSTAGWTAADCDYLCDGTDDQAEINAAIQALPSTGGEIVILDGIYNITATIAMNLDNVKLSGNGASTVLRRMWNSNTTEGVVSITAPNGWCRVENLSIDGNKENYSGSNNCGIYLGNSVQNNIISNNTSNNNGYSGIYSYNSDYNIISGNICENNNYSIYLHNSSDNNKITGNLCKSCVQYGIYLSGSDKNIVSNNICIENRCGFRMTASDNNSISINIFGGNEDYGMYLYNSNRNTISGNSCIDNNIGIRLYSTNNNNLIIGNTFIRGTGLTSDYTSSQYTIQCSGDDNLIVGNNIMGKNYTDSGTGNTWADNKYE